VIGGIAGASASAYEIHGLPEFGRCEKVATGAGIYKGPACISVAPSGTGTYEWFPLKSSGEKPTFSGSALESILTTAGHPTIRCTTASVSGEYTGPKTATVHIEFRGCKNSLGAECQSEPTAKSIIKTLALEGEIGFIKNQPKIVAVGLDLSAQSPFSDLIIFECGGIAEVDRVDASVIGGIKPIDKMTTASNLVYSMTSTHKQVPEKFEGGTKDTLTTTFATGLSSSSGASALKMRSTGKSTALLEIKAK
jgi:hypothetical protein